MPIYRILDKEDIIYTHNEIQLFKKTIFCYLQHLESAIKKLCKAK